MKPYFQDDAVTIYHADCREVMNGLDDNSIDTVITDPPYGLRFMGKKWDYEIPSVAVFAEMLRVAKSGATLLCFGGTRTWHRIAVNIEDAGWEIRDTLMWIYGSGFPKSLDIGKAIDKMQGNERKITGEYQYPDGSGRRNVIDSSDSANQYGKNRAGGSTTITKGNSPFEGYGTALKPAFEPIIMAMKPCEGTFAENALKRGVAGLNIDGARVGVDGGETHKGGFGSGIYGDSRGVETDLTPKGRFPANVIHDGSEEVLAEFPNTTPTSYATQNTNVGGMFGFPGHGTSKIVDSTYSASRFFYCAKASKAERNAGCDGLDKEYGYRENGFSSSISDTKIPRANHHPTVKPLALMEYLCTLTKTPTGGIVLDPYMGSGTTGMACKKTGRNFIGIEISEEYLEIAKRRIDSAKRMAQTVMRLEVE